jgi:hypothetical protein
MQGRMLTGRCLCGTVRYEVTGDLGPIAFCHCVECRRASGSAFAANANVARAEHRFTSGAAAIVLLALGVLIVRFGHARYPYESTLGPDDGALLALLQHPLDVIQSAQPAAELHLRADFLAHFEDGRQRRQVGRLVVRRAAKGAIQVDHVQPAGAQGKPASGGVCRVVAVGGLSPWIALRQAHHQPTAQVDGRVKLEIEMVFGCIEHVVIPEWYSQPGRQVRRFGRASLSLCLRLVSSRNPSGARPAHGVAATAM